MPIAKRTPLPTWADHVAKWKNCQKCPLGCQRDRIVLARGTVPCDVLFIGEAPGASEDSLGQPFVGPAGKCLDGIIEQSLPQGVTWAMTNLVACFPREAKSVGINEPTYNEIRACRLRLVEFINLCRPRLIVRVGLLATANVSYTGAHFIDIVHPAAILRMPLAQKQMAAQKSIVVLRSAIDDMVQQNYPNFTIGREEHAGIQSHGYLDAEIPF